MKLLWFVLLGIVCCLVYIAFQLWRGHQKEKRRKIMLTKRLTNVMKTEKIMQQKNEEL